MTNLLDDTFTRYQGLVAQIRSIAIAIPVKMICVELNQEVVVGKEDGVVGKEEDGVTRKTNLSRQVTLAELMARKIQFCK